MTTYTENNGEPTNIELKGIVFNQVTENGARKGFWIDKDLGMIIWYSGTGDSQVMSAGLNTDRKMLNKVEKLIKTGAFN